MGIAITLAVAFHKISRKPLSIMNEAQNWGVARVMRTWGPAIGLLMAFHKINDNFQTTFKKLFGGGHAFMRLTDEENSAESGIDVVASPPGKKLQNVLLLSGGEKALTALSLLVGIFQYQPSPFCILDEVDAPLDEANVGRFTELVKEMSVQTQFVLITHSKKTMGIAPVLYGVTMQEPGVSKLVSVKFGETA